MVINYKYDDLQHGELLKVLTSCDNPVVKVTLSSKPIRKVTVGGSARLLHAPTNEYAPRGQRPDIRIVSTKFIGCSVQIYNTLRHKKSAKSTIFTHYRA
jgi:hypothetical protein